MRLFALCFISSFCFFTQICFIKAEETSSKPRSAQLVVQDKHLHKVTDLAWSEDNQILITGSVDQTAISWDLSSGKPKHTFVGHKAAINSVSLSANGASLVTGSDDETAILWDVKTGQKKRVFDGDQNWITTVSVSDNGRLLATACPFRSILWDTKSGKILHQFYQKGPGLVTLSPDGQTIITNHRTSFNYWNTATGKRISSFAWNKPKYASVVLSRDGRVLVTSLQDHQAILRVGITNKRLHTLVGHKSAVVAVTMSKDGTKLVTGSTDHEIILWDMKTGNQLQSFTGNTGYSHPNPTISQNGRHLITGTKHGTIKIWDVRSANELCQMMSFDKGQEWLVITPDGLFDCSPGAMQYVSYRQPRANKLIPLQKYQDKYYTTGLLPLVLAGKAPQVDVPANQFVPE